MPHLVVSCLLILALVPFSESVSRMQQLKQEEQPLNMTCVQANCDSAYANCMQQPKCSDLLTCLTKCWDRYEQDTSYTKSTTHSCINTCTFSYADFYYTGFTRCLTDNNCFTLPAVSVTCRYPHAVTMRKLFQTGDLKGGWWVMRGYNPAYDCIPCQHIFYDGFTYEKDKFVYRPTFEARTVNGSNTLVNGSILVDLENNKPGEAIELDYYLYGLPFSLRWHVLDGNSDNSTVLVYYCGSLLGRWNYEGALVMARSPVEPPDAEVLYADMIRKTTNLEYDKFCKPQLSPCPN